MALGTGLSEDFGREDAALELLEANREIDRLLGLFSRISLANQLCDPFRSARISALVREALEE